MAIKYATFLLFFLGIFSTINSHQHVSAPLPLTLTEGCPSASVEGVNVIEGVWCDSTTPLVIPGAEPIAWEYFYASTFSQWDENMSGFIKSAYEPKIRPHEMTFVDFAPAGSTRAICSSATNQNSEMKLTLWTPRHAKGLANCAIPDLSGQRDPKNYLVYFKINSDHVSARTGTGEKIYLSKRRV